MPEPDFHAIRISIHVPRVGDDRKRGRSSASCSTFLSTSPAWGTTHRLTVLECSCGISIHVPRVGDDQLRVATAIVRKLFLSTSPAWGTTYRWSCFF